MTVVLWLRFNCLSPDTPVGSPVWVDCWDLSWGASPMHLGRLIITAKWDQKEKRLKKQEVRDLEVHFFSYKKNDKCVFQTTYSFNNIKSKQAHSSSVVYLLQPLDQCMCKPFMVQCVNLALFMFPILVEAWCTAHKHINESIYSRYSKSNLVFLPLERFFYV